MTIILRLEERMKERGVLLRDLASEVGITIPNMSRIKTGKVRSLRLETLDSLCEALHCQPGDLLEYETAASVGDPVDRAEDCA